MRWGLGQRGTLFVAQSPHTWPGAPITHTGLEFGKDVAQHAEGLLQDVPQGRVGHGLQDLERQSQLSLQSHGALPHLRRGDRTQVRAVHEREQDLRDWRRGPRRAQVKVKVRGQVRGHSPCGQRRGTGQGDRRGGRGERDKGEGKAKGLPEAAQERDQLRAGLGLTLPTHLQLLEVPGPGEWAGAAAPVLQQEGLFLGSKGRGQPAAGGLDEVRPPG